MKRLKNISEQLLIGFLLIISIFIGMFFQERQQINYENKLLNNNLVHKIEIQIQEEDYVSLLNNPKNKIKYHADIKIDGEHYKNVAFSTRGNASLFDEDVINNQMFSYKINFGYYNNGQNYYGLDKLLLDNTYRDSSLMRNKISYAIMEEAGLSAPISSYTELFINNVLKGLYVAIEDVDKSFIKRAITDNVEGLYKPTPLVNNFTKQNIIKDTLFESEDLDRLTLLEDGTVDSGGSDLVYRDDSIESYPAIFENEVIKSSAETKERVIEAIKSLGTIENIEEYWDIDELASYFAANSLLMNWDSYLGPTMHNYYLVVKNNKLSVIPWDYDQALTAVQINQDGARIDSERINQAIDNPLIEATGEERPLWNSLSQNEMFMQKYYTKTEELIEKFIFTDRYIDFLDYNSNLIRPYVEKSRNIEEYNVSIENIKRHLLMRAEAIQNQLDIMKNPLESPGEGGQ